MIIRSIELQHWRGIPAFGCEFDHGLNILYGPNEAGKSSVVEALHWALFQDVVGGGKIKNEIEAIIPAFAPGESPSVKVLLSFPSCEALVSKKLATEAAGRECQMVLRYKDQPDAHYEQSRAQEMLWQLMSNDGIATNAPQGLTPDGDIVFSKQGKSTFYVEQDISAMVRSALADNPLINAEGGIALSPQLEAIRLKIQKLYNAELGKRLSANATDTARKQSNAATLRDQLVILEKRIASQHDLLKSIDTDRQRIDALEPQLQQAQQQSEQFAKDHETQLQLQRQQQQADHFIAEKTAEYTAAQTARDQLQAQVEQIARHRETVATAQKKIQANQPLLHAAQEKVKALQGAMEEAEKHRANCQQRQREKLYAMEAWASWLEVKEKQTTKNHAQQVYQQLRELAQQWQTAREQLPHPDKIIQLSRLSNWRERYRDIVAEEQRLAHQIRFDMKWEKPVTLKWRADNGEWQCEEIPANTPFNLRGKSTFDLHLEDQGRIKVMTRDDKVTRHDARGIDAKRQQLNREMAKYGCDGIALPAGFDMLETQIEQQQQLLKTVEAARTEWLGAVRGCKFMSGVPIEDTAAVLSALYGKVQECTEEWQHAKNDARQYVDFYPEQVTPAVANEARRTAIRERQQWEQSAIAADKDYAQKAGLFHQEKEQTAKLENELRSDQEKANNAESELRRLCADGQNDAVRNERLKESTDRWVLADAALKAAKTARAQLGNAIDEAAITALQTQLQRTRAEIQSAENELSACRARVEYQCHDDPQNALEQLEFEREEMATQLEREETRLRGIVLLQSALETQRLRFGDSIAAPLNAQLSPWLSTLRGKTTRVEFDSSGKRLTGIQTQDAHGHYRLDFTAHSGGMQEQAALLVRLIYLQLASNRLPSQRLPVILDDPLTHTDSYRREGLLKVLLEAAASLQIIYVSCHGEHLEQLGQARTIAAPMVRE